MPKIIGLRFKMFLNINFIHCELSCKTNIVCLVWLPSLEQFKFEPISKMQFGRLGTAIRQGTAMREVNLGGVGYNTKVSSVDRPVTNHGLSGMGAGSVGPGRQIYDRNYYNNLLRNKNNEIATEINKMK